MHTHTHTTHTHTHTTHTHHTHTLTLSTCTLRECIWCRTREEREGKGISTIASWGEAVSSTTSYGTAVTNLHLAFKQLRNSTLQHKTSSVELNHNTQTVYVYSCEYHTMCTYWTTSINLQCLLCYLLVLTKLLPCNAQEQVTVEHPTCDLATNNLIAAVRAATTWFAQLDHPFSHCTGSGGWSKHRQLPVQWGTV